MLKKSHSLHTIALLSLILSGCGDKKPSDSVEPLAVSIILLKIRRLREMFLLEPV